MAFIFPYTGNFIIPTDKLIFFRGVGIPPTRDDLLIKHGFFSQPSGRELLDLTRPVVCGHRAQCCGRIISCWDWRKAPTQARRKGMIWVSVWILGGNLCTGWCPPVISWFKSPMNYIYIVIYAYIVIYIVVSTINHS